jgi:hypothetical protein
MQTGLINMEIFYLRGCKAKDMVEASELVDGAVT